jgi:hypothetical protein
MNASTLTTIPTTTATATSTSGSGFSRTLGRTTVTFGVAAAAAVTAVAAAAHAAGVSFEVDGEAIPLFGFAQMTLLGAVIGGVLLAVLNRGSTSARRWFLRSAVALTAVSCLPSVAMPDDASTVVTLVVTHVLAAAIIVPALVRHARS